MWNGWIHFLTSSDNRYRRAQNNRIERDSGKAAADGVLTGAVHPKRSVKEMNEVGKTIGAALLNAVAVVAAYYIVGTSLHVVTKQFLDRVNFSSVVTVAACLGLLAVLSRLEARRWELKFVAVIAASIAILVIVGMGMAHAINMIAGGIG
ncbi:MAG: hypothetical protein QM234_08530 [Acidobacteriota bacterium]|nr:hypothetical protein [Acidobacteriota bacterium]